MHFFVAVALEPAKDAENIAGPLPRIWFAEHDRVNSVEVIAAVVAEIRILITRVRLGFPDAPHVAGIKSSVRFGGNQLFYKRFGAQFSVAGVVGDVKDGPLLPVGWPGVQSLVGKTIDANASCEVCGIREAL